MARKLTQGAAGAVLGVCASTVLNWERAKTEPPVQAMPAIFRFLGYNPFPDPKTLSERLLARRRVMGWSVKEAARQVGIDEGTWAAWEDSVSSPKGRHLALLEQLLKR